VHEELASTQDIVLAAARAGEPEGLAVLARRQSAGRGTQGRSWRSSGGNLHLSCLWRPSGLSRELPQWSLLAAVALADAVAAILPADAPLTLKWPNDLLLGGAKCAGILTEAVPDGAGGISWLVFGIGVNLAEAPPLPDRPTACLAEAGIVPPDPVLFAEALLASLDYWRARQEVEGFTPLRAEWLRRGPAPGSPLKIRAGGMDRHGIFAGLASDGRLLLELPEGSMALISGEIIS